MKALSGIVAANAMLALIIWGYYAGTGADRATMGPVAVAIAVAMVVGVFFGIYVGRPIVQPRKTFRAKTQNAAAASLLDEIR